MMDREEKKVRVKRICLFMAVVLILVMSAALGIMIVREKKSVKERNAEIAALEEKTKPYREELFQRKDQLAKKEKELDNVQEMSVVSVAFVVSSNEEAEIVKELAKDYAFPITIVLNGDVELEEVRNILAVSGLKEYDLILTVSKLEDTGFEKVKQIRMMLPEYGYENRDSFLLLLGDDTEENMEALGREGYTSLIRYRENQDSGITGQGQKYFPYSIVKNGKTIEERMIQLLHAPSDMLFIFQMQALSSKLLKKEDIAATLEQLQEYQKEQKLQLTDVTGILEGMDLRQEQVETRKREFEVYKEEQEKIIEELKAKIEQIYEEENMRQKE